MYSSSIYTSKYIFSQTTIVILNQKFVKTLEMSDPPDVPAGCEHKV